MATYTSTSGAGSILPPEYVDTLIVEPVARESIALNPVVSTAISTSSLVTHIPIIRDDAGANWIAEGSEIAPDDAAFDEVSVRPSKVAGLSIISRELANDSTPAAAEMIGAGLARSIAKKIDEAMFAATVLPAPAPAGLASATGVTEIDSYTLEDLDVFADAVSRAEQLGVTLTSWVANPADALTLAQLKVGVESRQPLLTTDPTQSARRVIEGLPLLVSPAVEQGTIWGMPASRVVVVRREDVSLETSTDVFFTSDRTALKATMRIGFAFPSHQSIVKISVAATP